MTGVPPFYGRDATCLSHGCHLSVCSREPPSTLDQKAVTQHSGQLQEKVFVLAFVSGVLYVRLLHVSLSHNPPYFPWCPSGGSPSTTDRHVTGSDNRCPRRHVSWGTLPPFHSTCPSHLTLPIRGIFLSPLPFILHILLLPVDSMCRPQDLILDHRSSTFASRPPPGPQHLNPASPNLPRPHRCNISLIIPFLTLLLPSCRDVLGLGRPTTAV